MKKLQSLLILSIITGLISSSLFAQESETGKIRELNISGNLLSFNNLGLQYKSELKNGSFFRLGLTNINSSLSKRKYGTPSTSLNSNSTSFSGKFEVGLEKRKQITDKLTAFYGINLMTSTSFQRTKREDPTLSLDLRHVDDFSINPGFNSGFIFKITRAFSISAEIIPELIYTYSSHERIVGTIKAKDIQTGGSLNLDNESVRVSLVYQWNKK
jgi:hypothetical protein